MFLEIRKKLHTPFFFLIPYGLSINQLGKFSFGFPSFFPLLGWDFETSLDRGRNPALCKLDQPFCCFLLQIIYRIVAVELLSMLLQPRVLDCFGRFGNYVDVFSTPNQFWQQPATLYCCNSFYTCIGRTNCLRMYLACFSEIHINFASKDGPFGLFPFHLVKFIVDDRTTPKLRDVCVGEMSICGNFRGKHKQLNLGSTPPPHRNSHHQLNSHFLTLDSHKLQIHMGFTVYLPLVFLQETGTTEAYGRVWMLKLWGHDAGL